VITTALYAWCNHDLEIHLRNTATLIMCPNELKRRKSYEKVDIEKLGREITTVINRLSTTTGNGRQKRAHRTSHVSVPTRHR